MVRGIDKILRLGKKYYFHLRVNVLNLLDYFYGRMRCLLCKCGFLLYSRCKQLAEELLLYHCDYLNMFAKNKIIIDIGIGHGESTEYLASKNANALIIAFEKKSRYFRKSQRRLRRFSNVVVSQKDGFQHIFKVFGKQQVDSIYILFPDPWNKKRHFKRRRISCEWLQKAVRLLKPGGYILIATDHPGYREHIQMELKTCRDIWGSKIKIETGDFKPFEHNLPETHYYKKAKGRAWFVKIQKKQDDSFSNLAGMSRDRKARKRIDIDNTSSY